MICDVDHTVHSNRATLAGGLTIPGNLKCLCRQHQQSAEVRLIIHDGGGGATLRSVRGQDAERIALDIFKRADATGGAPG